MRTVNCRGLSWKYLRLSFWFCLFLSPTSNTRKRCLFSVHFSLYLSLFPSLIHQNQAVTLKMQLLIQPVGGSRSSLFPICCAPTPRVCHHNFVECLSCRKGQCRVREVTGWACYLPACLLPRHQHPLPPSQEEPNSGELSCSRFNAKV